MKKINLALLAITGLFAFAALSAADAADKNAKVDKKFEIMERDENEDSDTLAIPLDDSEIEDEEEINKAEKRDVFPLVAPEKQK